VFSPDTRRVMARMMGGTRLPPIPYLLSNMVTKKAPRKPPDDERDIKRDDELSDLPPEVRREEVRLSHPVDPHRFFLLPDPLFPSDQGAVPCGSKAPSKLGIRRRRRVGP